MARVFFARFFFFVLQLVHDIFFGVGPARYFFSVLSCSRVFARR